MQKLIDEINETFKCTYSLKPKSPKFKKIQEIEDFIKEKFNAVRINTVSKPYGFGKHHIIKFAFNGSNLYTLKVIIKERTTPKTWEIIDIEEIIEEFDNSIPQDYLNYFEEFY